MITAVIHRNLTDLNSEPHYLAERKTQALFGETVTILEERAGYLLVEQSDGYEGWAAHGALTEIADNSSENEQVLLVTDPVTAVYDESGEQAPPYFLTYGSVVKPTHQANRSDPEGELTEIENPQRGSLWIESVAISPKLESKSFEHTVLADSILNATREFLGVPYLWGGRSALGLDCSALAQLVYGFHGITLPRDSCDQRGIGQEVSRTDLQPADLVFSEGHIVIYLGDSAFIHASLGEGGVAINSYDPTSTVYRADLDRDYLIARRLF